MIRRLTALFPTVVIARRNVSRAKIRSALAALAIAIGVFAVGTVGATGVAFKSSQLGTLDEFGLGQVLLFPGPDAEGAFTPEDVRQIEDEVGQFGVVPIRSETALLDRRDVVRVAGVNYVEDPRRQFRIERGSLPPPNNWVQSAVVDAGYADRNGITVGDRITLRFQRRTPRGLVGTERRYRVAAITERSSAIAASDVYLPIEEADERRFNQVVVTTRGAEQAQRAADIVEREFNDRRTLITVLEFTFLIEIALEITSSINRLLAILGALSMIVAAISIANTMLMAVIRRRAEIGVLRAVGYRRGDVLRILLAEAAIIGAIGGFLGAVASLVVTAVANAFIGGEILVFTASEAFAFSLTQLGYILAAFAFGVVISVLAGLYPAYRAANERPVDALRG